MKFKSLCAIVALVGILASSAPTKCMWQRFFSKTPPLGVNAFLWQELRATHQYIAANRVGLGLIIGGLLYDNDYEIEQNEALDQKIAEESDLGVNVGWLAAGMGMRFGTRMMSGLFQKDLIGKRNILKSEVITRNLDALKKHQSTPPAK